MVADAAEVARAGVCAEGLVVQDNNGVVVVSRKNPSRSISGRLFSFYFVWTVNHQRKSRRKYILAPTRLATGA